MKKTTFLLLAVVMFSCNNKPKPETDIDLASLTDTLEVADTHNAQNSLDVKGAYKGTLPTASGEGMEITIVLEDSTYTKDVTYVGKNNKPYSSKGKYAWDKTGRIVTLSGEDKPNQYFVEENALRQLDIDGNRIVGEMGDDYVLRK